MMIRDNISVPGKLPIRNMTNMEESKSKDPLHGITLEIIVVLLSEHFGWEGLSERIPIRCFTYDPNLKSSLTFLRKTPVG